ncbi:MAG: hypothetical protein JSW33_12435 [bacterium]|nr:MAG: hypothetical protein JSW33_12435 [bacterium]
MKKPIIKMLIFSGVGASLGFAYYYFIGCRTGSCPITSNPVISTLYGFLVGIVAGFDNRIFKPKQAEGKEHE